MSSVSKFTIKDYNLIRKEWEKLFISAAQRCRDEEELSIVKRPSISRIRLTGMCVAVQESRISFIHYRSRR